MNNGCCAECYEIEPGVTIHRPWAGCQNIPPELLVSLPVYEQPGRIKRSEIQREADARHHIHRKQKSSRPLSDDYELVGLAGEIQFERDFGLKRNSELLPGGDGRVDFTFTCIVCGKEYTVDPKVARKPLNLIREVRKRHADILVLGRFHEEGDSVWVEWLGWEFDRSMLACPSKDFGYGVVNHFKPAQQLKPMYRLEGMIR